MIIPLLLHLLLQAEGDQFYQFESTKDQKFCEQDTEDVSKYTEVVFIVGRSIMLAAKNYR